jgi:hypothetical protein
MAHVTRAYGQWRPSWKNTSSSEATAAALTGKYGNSKDNTACAQFTTKLTNLTNVEPNELRTYPNGS